VRESPQSGRGWGGEKKKGGGGGGRQHPRKTHLVNPSSPARKGKEKKKKGEGEEERIFRHQYLTNSVTEGKARPGWAGKEKKGDDKGAHPFLGVRAIKNERDDRASSA